MDYANELPNSIKSAVAELMQLESDKTDINRRIKRLDSRRTQLQDYLLSKLSEDDDTAQGVVCNDVVVCVQDEEIGIVNDWDAFTQYMQDSGDFSLIKKAAVSSRIIEEIKSTYDWDFERLLLESIGDFYAYRLKNSNTCNLLRNRVVYVGSSFCYVCVDSHDFDKNTAINFTDDFNLNCDFDETEVLKKLISDGVIPPPPSCVEIITRKKIKLKKLS